MLSFTKVSFGSISQSGVKQRRASTSSSSSAVFSSLDQVSTHLSRPSRVIMRLELSSVHSHVPIMESNQ